MYLKNKGITCKHKQLTEDCLQSTPDKNVGDGLQKMGIRNIKKLVKIIKKVGN